MVANSYSFQESVDYLLSLGNEVSAMKLGLGNIKKLLSGLGKPAVNILKVQVAGTNGKGSVCAFLDSICRSAGIKTGLYTSPHLISITERIKINGVDLDEGEFAAIARSVRDTSELLVERRELESIPTFFEQVTAIALIAFANHDVDLTILETGLGGRLDATTAANAQIAAITRIDYDHQQYLGETLTEIAAEKAAIIHKGSKVVIGEQEPEAMSVITARCAELGISPRLVRDVSATMGETLSEPGAMPGGVVTAFKTDRAVYSSVPLGLLGEHQIENAKAGILLAETLQGYFPIAAENITNGLRNARHPGRLEWIGNILLDGAHNVGGAKTLGNFLDEFVGKPIILVYGAMADKNVAEISRVLFPKAKTIILTKASNSRALAPDVLAKLVSGGAELEHITLADGVDAAISEAKRVAGDKKVVVVTGSLYLVGEVKAILQNKSRT